MVISTTTPPTSPSEIRSLSLGSDDSASDPHNTFDILNTEFYTHRMSFVNKRPRSIRRPRPPFTTTSVGRPVLTETLPSDTNKTIVPEKDEVDKVHRSSDQRKRKRKREGKDTEISQSTLEEVELGGADVDLEELGNADEYHSGEIKRRSEGLGTKEEILGFLRGLKGKWTSKKRSRRIVDACEFGDKFPEGWKLLIGLKKKQGRVSIHCHGYISPAGEKFESCKEASKHLKLQYTLLGSAEQVKKVASEMLVDKKNEVSEQLDMDNLLEVPIQEMFDCGKCKNTFAGKDGYMKHLVSIHKKTARRFTFRRDTYKHPPLSRFSRMEDEGKKVVELNPPVSDDIRQNELVVSNDAAGREQVTSVCVWCGKEFSHEAIELESGSVGVMCPTCKGRITGQLDCGLSLN